MKIKRLDITGFKSFPERTAVPFSEGISAIVGPNGCGKSNIVDAIRWVMGEQSPKQLRGRQMDDVIFNGARTHQPSGLCEVTMVMANEGGSGPGARVGPSEVSITRRLYRSGDAEYLINRVPCRLKDIAQFFMDTGMGTKAYAIIEQGRIGALIDARPEERRALIDEAAGITRYKAQKKDAERKIESTQQNLVHIETLMGETKRQINSLTRAARKAERYKELKSELEAVDLALAWTEHRDLSDRSGRLASEKEGLEVHLTGLLSELETLEVELERAQIEIVDQEKDAEARAEAFYELQGEYDRLGQEAEFAAQRIEENHSRSGRLDQDLDRLRGQAGDKEEELERLRAELVEIERRVEEKRAARDELRRVWNAAKAEHDRAEERRRELSRRLGEIQSRRGRLEEMLAGHDRLADSQAARTDEIVDERERLEGELAELTAEAESAGRRREEAESAKAEAEAQSEATREQKAELADRAAELADQRREFESRLHRTSARLKAIEDVQADFGWYPEGVRKLMAAADRFEGLVGPVAQLIDVPAGYEAAAEAALGQRLHFVVVRDRAAAVEALAWLKKEAAGRCGFICLDELPDGADADLTRHLLGDPVLVENAREAVEVSSGRPALTRDGEWFGPGGEVVGGRDEGEDQSLLRRIKEMDELKERIDQLEAERSRLQELETETARQADGLQPAIDRADENVRAAQARIHEIDTQSSVLNSRQSELERRLAQSSRALEHQTAEARRLEEQKQSARTELDELEDEALDLTGRSADADDEAARSAARLEELQEQGQEASLEVRTAEERLSTARREASRTAEWLEDIQRQIEDKEAEQAEAAAEAERLAARRDQIAQSRAGFESKLESAKQDVDRTKERVDQSRAELNELETQARQKRRKRSEMDDAFRQAELKLQEINLKRQTLVERVQNDYQLDLENFPPERVPDVEENFDPDAAAERRRELRQKIDAMGEVNLTAIGEHEALTERYEFYKNQYDDLYEAIANLKTSIARINRTCKIRFKSTFEAVDQKLREIFPLLFEGGEAWLSLTDESNILESGVEIHVQPPGKKLTVMSLLSGGEKALTALALIFALYLIKPSPFCLLDETDAPLDEANIDRFNRLLKRLGQSSQIIMVTHNKRTMQIADTLYGVTMETAGVSKLVSVNLSQVEAMEYDGLVQTG